MHAKQAVIDTNVLVSAAINPSGAPGQIIAALRAGALRPVLSRAVFNEYADVLTRPRFSFRRDDVDAILKKMEEVGLMFDPPAISTADLPDPTDAPCVALARYAGCPVITGNVKHFPKAAGMVVLTPARWVAAQVGG